MQFSSMVRRIIFHLLPHDTPHVVPHNIPIFCVDHTQTAGGVGGQSIRALLNCNYRFGND